FPTFLCDERKLDRNFLGWLMRRPAFWEDLATRASGMGDRRRTLNPEALFKCEISLPPLPEQSRIATRIAELATQTEQARTLCQQADEEAIALGSSAGSVLSNPRNSTTVFLAELLGETGLRNGKSVKSSGVDSSI